MSAPTSSISIGANEVRHENIFNVRLDENNEKEREEDEENNNIDILQTTKQKLEALLLDDFEEQSLERLEFLLKSIEFGIRGKATLMSEDIIEFMTYLTVQNSLRNCAIDSFIARFEHKSKTVSKIGEFNRPQIGDLLIDAFCDLIITLMTEMGDAQCLESHCLSLLKLIRITAQMCVLRHGFTRLFAMYSWLISSQKSANLRNKTDTFYITNSGLMPSVPSSPNPNNNKFKPQPLNTSFANRFLEILTECISLSGPEIYLQCSDGGCLRPMIHIKSRLSKGWSFTTWVRITQTHAQTQPLQTNLLSFDGLLSIAFEISQLKSVLLIQLLAKSKKKFILNDLHNICDGRWHFLCLSHSIATKQDNFMVFIDGKALPNKLSIAYPHFSSINNNGIFPLKIGGFQGDIGQSFIYETALNSLTVAALYCVGATYNPPIYNRNGNGSGNERLAAFPRSVRQRAAPMQPRKYGYLLLPFCYGLNPKSMNERICLPYGWGSIDICDRKQQCQIVCLPHNKSSLISMGGICYIFYWLSPEFNGPNIYSDTQAANILTFLNTVICNNLTLLRQLFTMGLSSIKLYILRYIKSQFRTHLVLNCIKELLMIVTNCDNDARKQYFVDGFVSIITDTNYWSKAPPNVQNMVAQYIHTLIQTQSKVMKHCLTLTQIFDMIRAFYPNSFEFDDANNTEDKPKVSNDTRTVAYKLLESAIALVRLKPETIKYSSHRSISLLICKCVSTNLRCQILSAYCEMCHNAPDIMFVQMAQKSGFIKVLWDILQESDDDNSERRDNKILTDTHVKAGKILMGFIRNQLKVFNPPLLGGTSQGVLVGRSGVNKYALDELIYEIGISLGSLPPSLASYSSLLEIVLGKFKLNMAHSLDILTYKIQRLNSENDSEEEQRTFTRQMSLNVIPFVSDKDEISLIGALEGLMNLIAVSAYSVRTRMLMDILSLVKTSDFNQKLFCRQRNSWDKWMVSLISLETGNDDAGACNQLVSQIAATIVWRFLVKDDKGWISVMQLLESLNRRILRLIRIEKKAQSNSEEKQDTQSNGHSSPTPTQSQSQKISLETKLKCRILHEFLVQVLVLVLNRFLMDQLRNDPKDSKDKMHKNKGQKRHSKSNMNDLSDTSEHIKHRTAKNLTSILDITEWVLFNHRFSMLSIPRIRLKQDAKESDITEDMLFETPDSDISYEGDQIRNEILLLKRLLSCSLKFISFRNERQLVLRRLLRYLKVILPHKACHLVFDDVVNAVREFCNRLQKGDKKDGKKQKGKGLHKAAQKSKISIKSQNNMKTMRIAYSFLKNAYLRYNKRKNNSDDPKAKVFALKIRALQEEVYAFWGPMLFADKIDPNTANQMTLPLASAEDSLENGEHHIHSLWVFLQHQKWWEYQFQDKNMKKFKIEYSNHEKDEKKKKLTNKDQFNKYYNACTVSHEQISKTEMKRIQDSLNHKRKKKRENMRDLKKYMDFFDEDFQCRFPNENTPDFWELDPRESSQNHTRMLLVRNFKGSNHNHAAVKSTRKRAQSRSNAAAVKRRNSGGPRARLLKQISSQIVKDFSFTQDSFPSNATPAMMSSMSIESIPEEKEKLMSDSNISVNTDEFSDGETYDSDNQLSDDSDFDEKEQYQSANLNGKKVLIECLAVSISPFFKISGTMYVTEHHLIFEGHEYIENVHEQNAKDQIKLTQQRKEREIKTLKSANQDKEQLLQEIESENKQQFFAILANKDRNINDIIEYEIWSLAHIKNLYPRRYLLRENGLEIWIAGTSRSFFFTFKTRKKRGDVISAICKHSPRFIKLNHSKDLLVNPLKMLKHNGLTEKWQKRKISNFDYLMELNVLAGRSYNDITQYPVFPWVLTDFTSDTIDLNDVSIYRDLSKPIGALNPDRLQTFEQRYQDSLQDISEIPGLPPFYYGTHYMSAGIALYYLCRMEPFATLYINLHGGTFEIPDRTFYSITNAWDLSLNNMGDVKELIPECFYFPEFLRNINKFPLGTKTNDSRSINDVELPLWCHGSPEEFVRIMREALESEYVSSNLHNWIDLIFGYKQRGEESVAAHNVFFYLTYAGAVDIDKISDPTIKAATQQQIYHFGQTPNVLFHHSHPKRFTPQKCNNWLCELYLPYFARMDTKLDLTHSHSHSPSSVSISSLEELTDNGSTELIIQNKPFIIATFNGKEIPSQIWIIRSGQCLKIFDDQSQRILSFELPMLAYLDPSNPHKSTQLRNIIDTAATQVLSDLPIFELMTPDWTDSQKHRNKCVILSANGLYGITAGYVDCSIKVHWLKDGSTLASVTGLENGHNAMITCLALDRASQDMLISGAKDGSIVHWSALLKQSKPGHTPLIGKPYRLLSIHYDSVSVIAVNSKVGIIVSAAEDATIALYSIARKRFVRPLLLKGRESSESSVNNSLTQILLISISDNGYIILHSLDVSNGLRIPYLRVLSINGILICEAQLTEVLSEIKIDSSQKILICGGEACVLRFRNIHNLEIVSEIKIIDKSNHFSKYSLKKPSKSKAEKNINCATLTESILSPKCVKHSHSSAWRQQRFSFISQSLNNESRIISFDLDPDNTFITIVLFNKDINGAQLLLYPLPNTRHMHQFHKFVHCSKKILQTAKNTIWENIINVIESDESSALSLKNRHSRRDISKLYLVDRSSNEQSHTHSNTNTIVETGKNIFEKIKKSTKLTLQQSNSNHRPSQNGNANGQNGNNSNSSTNQNNHSATDQNQIPEHNHDSSIKTFGNALKSLWKKPT